MEKNNDKLFRWLLSQGECEWIEFKLNFHSQQEIGEDLSALSNGACIKKQSRAYLIFGVKEEENEKLSVVGTNFNPMTKKVGNEPLENWLIQRLTPRQDFIINSFDFEGRKVVVFEIHPAENVPVEFSRKAYIRVGSVTRELREFPDKQRKIWLNRNLHPFELEIALGDLDSSNVVELLDTQGYFELTKMPYPSTQKSVIEKLEIDNLLRWENGSYSITNLGALLFARNIDKFPAIQRKKIRVIQYSGKDKLKIKKNQIGVRGYAVGFPGLMSFINGLLPSNELIQTSLRQTVSMYPPIALRELVANAIIHQDFYENGHGPTVEIFSDRIEIVNTGIPMIQTNRFIDEDQSRNEYFQI